MQPVIQVNISAASCRLMFIPCGPQCVAAGCRGNCCDAPSRPSGCMVTIHKSEYARIKAHGGVVVDGLLQPRPGTRGCPFKVDGLCRLHFTPDKPFGCIASPFTLNKNGTLIIRNRYKLLPCYNGVGEKLPAYKAFYSSLELIFGGDDAAQIASRLDSGEGNFSMSMPAASYDILMENDNVKRAATHAQV